MKVATDVEVSSPHPRFVGEEASGKLDISFLFPRGRIHSSEHNAGEGVGGGGGGGS